MLKNTNVKNRFSKINMSLKRRLRNLHVTVPENRTGYAGNFGLRKGINTKIQNQKMV